MDYRHEKGFVLLRNNALGCFECITMTKHDRPHKSKERPNAFKPQRDEAIRKMRAVGHTDIPASGWEKVFVDRTKHQTWEDLAIAAWKYKEEGT